MQSYTLYVTYGKLTREIAFFFDHKDDIAIARAKDALKELGIPGSNQYKFYLETGGERRIEFDYG